MASQLGSMYLVLHFIFDYIAPCTVYTNCKEVSQQQGNYSLKLPTVYIYKFFAHSHTHLYCGVT